MLLGVCYVSGVYHNDSIFIHYKMTPPPHDKSFTMKVITILLHMFLGALLLKKTSRTDIKVASLITEVEDSLNI